MAYKASGQLETVCCGELLCISLIEYGWLLLRGMRL